LRVTQDFSAWVDRVQLWPIAAGPFRQRAAIAASGTDRCTRAFRFPDSPRPELEPVLDALEVRGIDSVETPRVECAPHER
jgi:hypothetical protein